MKRSISAICIVSIAASFGFAQQVDKESEIKRVRKELMQLQTERQKNKMDRIKDLTEFKEYAKRTAERLAAVKNETNSINQQIAVSQRRNDSLAALIDAANAQTRQGEMSQEAMRDKLALSCDQIIANLQSTPPMVRQNLIASAALLKNELRNKTIDNVEAFNRMQQIMIRAEEVTGSIQVSQESSPISEIRGTVYRLRIGAFFEAIVNLKGEECAVWSSSDTSGWKTIKDPKIAAEILKAANIREGKSLPAFVTLPLVAETEKGGNQ
jgi:chromosome segregation ATPase